MNDVISLSEPRFAVNQHRAEHTVRLWPERPLSAIGRAGSMYLIADDRCRLPRLIQVRFKQVDVGAPQQALLWNLKCAEQIGGNRLA